MGPDLSKLVLILKMDPSCFKWFPLSIKRSSLVYIGSNLSNRGVIVIGDVFHIYFKDDFSEGEVSIGLEDLTY